MPTPGYELYSLNGQSKSGAFGAPGSATGHRDPLLNIFGTVRLDRYFDNGQVLTEEAGLTHVQNEIGVTDLGRIQVGGAWRPWARVNWDATHGSLFAYYSGCQSSDQRFLSTGSIVRETSGIYHFEGQYNNTFWNNHARGIIGGSVRGISVDSHGTLLGPSDDNRVDWYRDRKSVV